MNEPDLIVKRDAGGRGFVLALRQIEVVQGFERSGVCVPKFAAMAGVKYQTFVTWRRKDGGFGAGRCLCPGVLGGNWLWRTVVGEM